MAQSTETDGKVAILGMGNPLLDISSPVTSEFLEKYNLRPGNAILAEEKHLPMYEELAKMSTVEYIAGGSTLNSIRVAQWMCQKKGVTAYFGCIGTDKYGEILEKCATEDGVLCHFMKVKDVATGTCAVCITQKERSLIANLSAANRFTTTHLKTQLAEEILSSAKIVYSAGFFLTVSPESALICAEHCLQKDKVYAINFSAEFIVEVFKDRVLAVMPYATHVFTNQDEVKKFGQVNNIEFKTVQDLAEKISSTFPSKRKQKFSLIVTQGASSVLVAKDGKSKSYPVEKLPPEKIVDTNGAGDAFVGGFLTALNAGKSEEECVYTGCYAAQVIIQTSGTKLTGTPKFVYKPKQ